MIKNSVRFLIQNEKSDVVNIGGGNMNSKDNINYTSLSLSLSQLVEEERTP